MLSIDFHQPSIEYAQSHNPYPDTIEFRCTTVEQLPDVEKFDIIVLSDILEHLDKPADFLRSIRPRLNYDGIVLVSIPNGRGPFELESALDKRGLLLPSYWLFNALSRLKGFITRRKPAIHHPENELPYNFDSGHAQFFTMTSFKRVLTESGFAVDDFRRGAWLGALCTSTWMGRYS